MRAMTSRTVGSSSIRRILKDVGLDSTEDASGRSCATLEQAFVAAIIDLR